MITKITPEIIVEDVNKTVTFYESVFGFKKMMTVPEEGTYDWALIAKDGNELMLQTKASLLKDLPSIKNTKIGNSMMLYIEVKDIDNFYTKIKTKVTLVKDIHDTFYGSREFIVQDCNNYIIIFSERKG